MSALEDLIACAGSWRGTNVLHDPETGKPDESESTLEVTPLLRGTFVRLAYTWAWAGTPHEGVMLLGFVPKEGTATVYWIDTMHMGRKVLTSAGQEVEGAPLLVLGSYPAPTGPDWGWSMEFTAAAGREVRIAMLNISPEGEKYPAVDMVWTPA